MKKVLAFDLDGTLAPSKSPLPDRISELLTELLEYFHICVISGGKFEQFNNQLMGNLNYLLLRFQCHLLSSSQTRQP